MLTENDKSIKKEIDIKTEKKNLWESHESKQGIDPVMGYPSTEQKRSELNEVVCDLKKNKFSHKFTVRECISEVLYLCEFCHEYFTAFNLHNHIALVHGKKWLLSCVDCMKDFLPVDGAKTTKCNDCIAKLNKVSSSAALRYKCETCGKGFVHRCYLIKHLNNHKGIKPFSCEKCNRRFTERGNLKRHMVVHTDTSRHSCSFCRKSFSQMSLLKRHMFFHTGELNNDNSTFTCKICSKVFSFRHSLTRHMRIHTGERPYQCSICKLSFKQSSNLKRHVITHTGGDFECDLCSKKYVQKSNLKYHILHHHMI